MLLGHVTRDIELRYSDNQNAYSRYGLAVRRPYAKQGEQSVDFFNLVAFGKAAEFAAKYFKKGSQIAIVGRLVTKTWEDNGQKRTSFEIIVEEHHFAGSKGAGEAGAIEEPGLRGVTGQTGFIPTEIEDDDDLPF